jgi:hypothetical protein
MMNKKITGIDGDTLSVWFSNCVTPTHSNSPRRGCPNAVSLFEIGVPGTSI